MLKIVIFMPFVLLMGCSSSQWKQVVEYAPVIQPYQIEIAQGNVVTKEQLALIKLGSSPDEVREQLGSPTLIDVFHPHRWDYHFSFARHGQPLQQRTITLFFQDEKLKKIDAPPLPSEAEFSASISTFKPRSTPLATELTSDQIKALPLPTRKPSASQSAPQGAVRTYPPLETTP